MPRFSRGIIVWWYVTTALAPLTTHATLRKYLSVLPFITRHLRLDGRSKRKYILLWEFVEVFSTIVLRIHLDIISFVYFCSQLIDVRKTFEFLCSYYYHVSPLQPNLTCMIFIRQRVLYNVSFFLYHVNPL